VQADEVLYGGTWALFSAFVALGFLQTRPCNKDLRCQSWMDFVKR
jgi:hypothetical protein